MSSFLGAGGDNAFVRKFNFHVNKTSLIMRKHYWKETSIYHICPIKIHTSIILLMSDIHSSANVFGDLHPEFIKRKSVYCLMGIKDIQIFQIIMKGSYRKTIKNKNNVFNSRAFLNEISWACLLSPPYVQACAWGRRCSPESLRDRWQR